MMNTSMLKVSGRACDFCSDLRCTCLLDGRANITSRAAGRARKGLARGMGPRVPERVAVAAAIFYIFLWASAYVPSKIAAVESPPFWFLAARFLTAGALLVLLALALRRPFPATLRAWLVVLALGVLANALYLGLTYTALRHMSAGIGA